MIDPQVLIAGPSGFATLSDVQPVPTTTGFSIVCQTDQSVQLRVRWWPASANASVAGATGQVDDSTAVLGKHTISASVGPGHEGDTFNFEITSLSTPPPTLRPYQGTVQILGARDPQDIPVRFYSFSGPMTGAVPALGTLGNWSRYTWSQWNSKGT